MTRALKACTFGFTKLFFIFLDIFEHYLKNEKKLSGQALSEEVDMYEEYIRQKISDLIRPPRKPKEQNKGRKNSFQC